MITNNVKQINNCIERAAKKSGRLASDMVLIAVTKSVPKETLLEELDSLKSMISHFGENRVQELVEKQKVIQDINWHMIGHLQRNKVKQVVGNVALIHSLDSIRLAEEINAVSKSRDIISEVLVEINIANEKNKYGIAPQDTHSFIESIIKLPNIKVKGLMTVAPFVPDPEQNRVYFAKMNDLFISLKSIADMQFLSMGMTNDYEIAIEEGANMVRIGTAIFGERA